MPLAWNPAHVHRPCLLRVFLTVPDAEGAPWFAGQSSGPPQGKDLAVMAESPANMRRGPLRVWLTGGLFLLAGAILVLLGGVISGLSDYDRSIFAGVGITLGLVGPLFVAERVLSASVAEVRNQAAAVVEDVKEVRTALSRLDQAYQQQLGQTRIDQQRRLDDISEGNFEPLVGAYNRAAGLGWIDKRGLRVATGVKDLWLLVRVSRGPDDDAEWLVKFAFEGPGLGPVGKPVTFTGDTNAVDVFGRLKDELQQVGRWPGDSALMPHDLLQTVARSLGKINDLHTGSQADIGVDAVIELVGDDWAVTDSGLESLRFDDIRASRDDVLYTTADVYSRLESRVIDSGLDTALFRSALNNAQLIYRTLQDEMWKKLGRVLAE